MSEPVTPQDRYLDLMRTLRQRFDVIKALKSAPALAFEHADTAAFHGRKIIEGMAFGCIVAVDASKTTIPREARGQWDARKILLELKRKGLGVLPSPSRLRLPTPHEQSLGAGVVVEGIAEARLTEDALLQIYQRLHGWLHEANPYVHGSHAAYYAKNAASLWDDLALLRRFMERHAISINDHGFYCTLWDSTDGQTKIFDYSR